MSKIIFFMFIVITLLASSDAFSQQYQILKRFDSDSLGLNPTGTPIVVDSFFYGMTRAGGITTGGTIYRLKPDGSDYEVIHSFDRFNGTQPSGSLLNVGDWLYGMTYRSGTNDEGVIFKIKKDGTDKSVIHSFSLNPDDAAGPSGSLILVDSVLYGMTQHGGKFNKGAIFKVKPDGSDFALLYSFDWMKDSGSVPHGDLVYKDGVLFGIAQHIVFSINTDGTNFKLIKVFRYGKADGYMMLGNPAVQDSVIFGTTEQLDSIYGGSVFRVNKDGSDFQTIHRFPKYDSTDGSRPTGHLFIKDNKIYGMTSSGGQFGYGTIFMMNPDGTNYRILYNFGSVENDGRGAGNYNGLAYYKGSLAGVVTWGKINNGVLFKFGDISLLDSCEGYSFSYYDFLRTTNLQMNGLANNFGHVLRISPRGNNDSGSVFYREPMPIASNFKCSFSFKFSDGKNDFDDGSPEGADGLAFVIQGENPYKIGRSGGGIGFAGIKNSFAVEFDAYNNGDDLGENNGSHLAVFANGMAENTSDHHSYGQIGYTDNIPLLKADASVYYAKIEYSYSVKVLRIWLDKTDDFTKPPFVLSQVDIPALVKPVDNNKAYIGFTAAGGNSVQNADLLTWTWCYNNEQKLTDIPENENDEIGISPNPASDYIEISFPPLPLGEGWGEGVRIFDLLGMEITTPNLTPTLSEGDGVVRLDVSLLSPGVYFVQVGDKMYKFVKM
jgi:uncharacterized repeat protein (TIGR03803 family)